MSSVCVNPVFACLPGIPGGGWGRWFIIFMQAQPPESFQMKQLGDGGESNSDFWAGLIGAVHRLSFLESVYPQKHLPRSYQVPGGIQYILPVHLNEGILVQGVGVSGVGVGGRAQVMSL